MLVFVYATVLAVFFGVSTAPRVDRVCSKASECPRANFMVECVSGDVKERLMALPIGADRLLVVSEKQPEEIYWQGKKGQFVAFDPEYRIWVFRFGIPTGQGQDIKSFLSSPASVTRGMYVHSHVYQEGDIGVTRTYLVAGVDTLSAKLHKPLHVSELGAVFYTHDGKFAGIGALKNGARVVVLVKGLEEFLSPNGE